MRGRLHSASPGDVRVSIKAGSVRREGLGWVEAAAGEPGGAVLSSVEGGKEASHAGLCEFPGKHRSWAAVSHAGLPLTRSQERGPWRFSLGKFELLDPQRLGERE